MKLRRAAVAAGLAVAAVAANAQVVVVNEGFENVAGLPAAGWVLNNASTPIGTTGWFQADPGHFDAFAGTQFSYVAANFNNAAAGGTIANYLFSPVFTTQGGGTVSFWARSDAPQDSSPGQVFTDHIRVGRTAGGSTPGDFIQIGTDITLTGTWTQYSFAIGAQGVGATGRAVVEYFGVADASDYIGIDSFNVNVVPEPETWALFGLGLAALGVVKRRRKPA
jgi:hypothetical protein